MTQSGEERALILAAGKAADNCRTADSSYRQLIEGKPYNLQNLDIWMIHIREVETAIKALSDARTQVLSER